MVKKREGYKIVVPQEQLDRIARNECPSCGKSQSAWTRSKTWRCCSKECTKKYSAELVMYGWPELRRKAIKRDNKCLKCGVVHTSVVDVGADEEYYHTYEIIIESTPYIDEAGYKCEKLKILNMSKYVVDHIQAIALNGDEWDINNLQTLCIECNKHKTKKDIGKIARLRFKEQLGRAGQKFLGEEYE